MKLLSNHHRQQLREARLERGWTQGELAERIGCTNVMLCWLETGKRQPSLDLLNHWCDALDMKLSIEVEAI